MSRHFVFAAAAAALLAACASTPTPPDRSLAGATLRMTTQSGAVTRLRFFADHRVEARFRGGTLAGRWRAEDGRLCFWWPRASRECWPYRSPFARGRTRTLTSDRGNVLRVTRL